MANQENLNKFKIGECHNVGNCTHIGERQAIPSDIANSGGFKCKYCGEQLFEVKKKKSFGQKYGKVVMIIIAALLVLGGAGYGIYALLSSSSKPTAIKLDKEKLSMKVGDKAVITPSAEPEGTKATFIFKKNGKNIRVTNKGEVTALNEGQVKVLVKCNENPELKAFCLITVVKDRVSELQDSVGQNENSEAIVKEKEQPITKLPTPPTPPPTSAGPKVSFGRYQGPANGMGGTIYVTKNYSLNLHDDGEPLQLSPGDEIQQTKFTKGELRGGVWVHNGSRRFFTR